MSGFFPVMMFGLPAACLAMYRSALPERRKAVGGMLLSVALTSFLTGVTEPIEFSFMFLAPVLHAIHAVLTGVAMALMHLVGVRLDLKTPGREAEEVAPSSEAAASSAAASAWVTALDGARNLVAVDACTTRLRLVIGAQSAVDEAALRRLGARGVGNIRDVKLAASRICIALNDAAATVDSQLKALLVRGIARPAPNSVHFVIGPQAPQLFEELNRLRR